MLCNQLGALPYTFVAPGCMLKQGFDVCMATIWGPKVLYAGPCILSAQASAPVHPAGLALLCVIQTNQTHKPITLATHIDEF